MKICAIKSGLAAILVMLAAAACGSCLPVSTPRHTAVELEALRIVKGLRAAVAEVDAHGAGIAALDVAQLCSRLQDLRNANQSQNLVDLADSLPAPWFDDPQTAPGVYGGYRFVLIRVQERGVYAIPDPAGPSARFIFYAGLPAGLFMRKAEGFVAGAPSGPPDPGADREWRPVRMIK